MRLPALGPSQPTSLHPSPHRPAHAAFHYPTHPQANISEEYVLMSEPDHIFLRPLRNFMRGDAPAAFPFFYIEPHKPENIAVGGVDRGW